MKPNKLRQLLNEGKPTLGTHVIAPWPGMIELIGHSGSFDYVEYVGEYSPWSLEQLENIGRAIELFPNMSGMMKVEEQGRGLITMRSLDAGIQNILFTDVRSAADVRECVRLVRSERPESGGIHGCGMRRAAGYVLEGGAKSWCDAMDETVIAVMIEKVGAMQELEQILAIEGVDMLQFGPSDYSISAGVPGQGGSPLVQDAHKKMIALALQAGKHPRVEIGSLEQAKPWLDLGVRHFCVGWDAVTVFAWSKQQGKLAEDLGLRGPAAGGEAGYSAAKK